MWSMGNVLWEIFVMGILIKIEGRDFCSFVGTDFDAAAHWVIDCFGWDALDRAVFYPVGFEEEI